MKYTLDTKNDNGRKNIYTYIMYTYISHGYRDTFTYVYIVK